MTPFANRANSGVQLLGDDFAFFAFIGVLLYQSIILTVDSWVLKQHSESPWMPPIYPIITTIPIAALLLLLQGMAKLIRDFRLAITGKE